MGLDVTWQKIGEEATIKGARPKPNVTPDDNPENKLVVMLSRKDVKHGEDEVKRRLLPREGQSPEVARVHAGGWGGGRWRDLPHFFRVVDGGSVALPVEAFCVSAIPSVGSEF